MNKIFIGVLTFIIIGIIGCVGNYLNNKGMRIVNAADKIDENVIQISKNKTQLEDHSSNLGYLADIAQEQRTKNQMNDQRFNHYIELNQRDQDVQRIEEQNQWDIIKGLIK